MHVSKKNHPKKSFYNSEAKEIYVIYKQSEAFIIKLDDLWGFRYFDSIMEDGTEMAIGDMYLIFN